jgi:hypothetical protein
MRMFSQTRWTASTAIALLGSAVALPALAQAPQFGAVPVDISKFVLVASPIGSGSKHQLLIIEQVSNKKQCWSENGAGPTMIDPLLLNYDFTGICDRKIDSNGYSIRMAGTDLALQYRISVVRRDNDMLLLGRPVRKGPEMLLGRTGGITTGFAKFQLEPGWQLMRRTYKDKPVGHLYLITDQVPVGLDLTPRSAAEAPPNSAPNLPPATSTSSTLPVPVPVGTPPATPSVQPAAVAPPETLPTSLSSPTAMPVAEQPLAPQLAPASAAPPAWTRFRFKRSQPIL